MTRRVGSPLAFAFSAAPIVVATIGCASPKPLHQRPGECSAVDPIIAEIDAIKRAHSDDVAMSGAEEDISNYKSWEQEASFRRSDLFEQYALIAQDIRLVDTAAPCYRQFSLAWGWMFAGARHAMRKGDAPSAMERIEVLDATASRAGYAEADDGPSLLIDARRLGTVIIAQDGFAANSLDAVTAERLAALIEQALPEVADQYAYALPRFSESWARAMSARQFFRKQYGLGSIEWTRRDTELLATIVAPLIAEWNDPAASAAMFEKAKVLDSEMREAVESIALTHKAYWESRKAMISTRDRLRAFIRTGLDPGPGDDSGG